MTIKILTNLIPFLIAGCMDPMSNSFMSFSTATDEAHSKPTKKHLAVVPRSQQRETGMYLHRYVMYTYTYAIYASCIHMLICT